MNVLAVLFRLLSLLSVAGLAAFLWFKFDTFKKQTNATLDDVVSDAYTILQVEKEAQWKDVSAKKMEFNDVYDANDQVDPSEDNPLSLKVDALRTSEDAILRNPDYRDSLDSTALEFGPDALLWDSVAKKWIPNPSVKLEAPVGLQDPFSDKTKFPFHDVKKEDGTIIKGVSRENRLRTAIGMFYRDRHDKFMEISKLRVMVVDRDKELREYQDLFAKEKEMKEFWEDNASGTMVILKVTRNDLANEKEERRNEQEAFATTKKNLEDEIAKQETEKENVRKTLTAERDALAETNKKEMEALRKKHAEEIAAAIQEGRNEILAMQQGGEVADDEISEEMNPFMIKKSGPPEVSEVQVIAASQMKEIPDIGAPSTIARIDSVSGMILLPVGKERGIIQGTVFTVWKDKKEAARIRVQSSREGFLLAYILPRFGEPNTLRPGDSVYIVPESENI